MWNRVRHVVFAYQLRIKRNGQLCKSRRGAPIGLYSRLYYTLDPHSMYPTREKYSLSLSFFLSVLHIDSSPSVWLALGTPAKYWSSVNTVCWRFSANPTRCVPVSVPHSKRAKGCISLKIYWRTSNETREEGVHSFSFIVILYSIWSFVIKNRFVFFGRTCSRYQVIKKCWAIRVGEMVQYFKRKQMNRVDRRFWPPFSKGYNSI